MKKIKFENGTLVSNAKVEIGGTIYDVTPEQYEGTTPLSASNMNAIQDNAEEAIDEVATTLEQLKTDVENKHTYSTEEQVIGTWIDGKPLYRKVVTGTTKNVVSGEIDTKIGITNVDTVISYSANVDGWIITYLTRLINLSGTLRLDIMNQESDSGFSVKPFKCIVEYTKTTD